jgi:hypothetical protein
MKSSHNVLVVNVVAENSVLFNRLIALHNGI